MTEEQCAKPYDEILDQIITSALSKISYSWLERHANREITPETDTWDKCYQHNIDVCIVIDPDKPHKMMGNPLVWSLATYYVSDLYNNKNISYKIFCKCYPD